MKRSSHLTLAIVLLSALTLALAQETPAPKESASKKPAAAHHEAHDVDPLALKVFYAVAQPIQQAHTFAFTALISEEQPTTNGQVVTEFHSVECVVQRPDKLHLTFRRNSRAVQFFADAQHVTLFAPDAKLYAVLPTNASTIDAALADLNRKNVDIPIAPFLRSDLYDAAAKSALTAYVIGRVTIFDQEVHQLAFSEPDADYQLWVTGGASPRFVRAEIVNKQLPGKPRTILQFLDWKIDPQVTAEEFTFHKPAGASQISFRP